MQAGEKELILTQFDSLCEDLITGMSGFISSHADSYIGLLALSELNMSVGRYRQAQITKLHEQLSPPLKLTEKGLIIERTTKLPEIPQVGDKFIDIVQVNPNGDTLRLSDHQGNYILIDFWASWCPPCRGANPALKELYSKYHDKGLVIFGVSGDVSHENWIKAITDDSLTWPQVSDLQGWNNEAFARYGVSGIPSPSIIDPEGIIVGREYCTSELITAIEEIFK